MVWDKDKPTINTTGQDSHPEILANWAAIESMLGALNTPTELTVATGAITVSLFMHTVDTESDDASDDLDTINGGVAGRMVILKAENDARTVVIKHNTGNIWLKGQADLSLDDLEDGLALIYTGAKWIDIGAIPPVPISTAQWGYLGDSSGIDHYVDRGDPADYDFTLGNLTTDGTWRDLDLSSIVPAGAVAVDLIAMIRDDATGSQFMARKNGNSNDFNRIYQATQLANQYISTLGPVAVDSNRVIEYFATNTTWDAINIIIKGWWIS